MTNTNAPRIERAMPKLYVPHEGGKIAFASHAFGPNIYQSVGKSILENNLKVPTGDYSASLLHTAYCDSQFKDEPKFKNVRELMKSKWLWIFNQNLWTPEGVYVIQDLEAKGRSKLLGVNELEGMLKGGKEINGLRFSKDGRVRFAPRETYKLGNHTSESLSKDGFVIASYNVDGAKKLAEVSSKFKNNPFIHGVEVAEGNQHELRVSVLVEYVGRLLVGGYDWGDDGALAFGVL